MGKFYPVYKRELGAYFGSPIAYTVLGIYLIVCGYFFFAIFGWFSTISFQAMRSPYGYGAPSLNMTDGVLRPLFGDMSVIMLLVMPMLTMRLFSEEKKAGTAELLFTYPIRDWEIILGKFAACVTIFTLMLAITLIYPYMMLKYGKPEAGPIISGYIGLFLMGVAFIALGTFASSLTENQIVASIATFGGLLLFWVVGWSSELVHGKTGELLSHLSIIEHFQNFAKGVVETKDIVYYLSFAFFFLFLTLRSIESKRWRA
jgi:ABC-2 type transport system permease protein